METGFTKNEEYSAGVAEAAKMQAGFTKNEENSAGLAEAAKQDKMMEGSKEGVEVPKSFTEANFTKTAASDDNSVESAFTK